MLPLLAALLSIPVSLATKLFEVAFALVAQWLAAGASDALIDLARVLDSSTAVPLGTSFGVEFSSVLELGAALALPLLVVSAIQAIVGHDLSLLLRNVFVRLPLALLGSAAIVEIVRLALVITDAWSRSLLSLAGTSVTGYLDQLSTGFLSVGTSNDLVPILVAVAGVFAALLLWLELAMRAAAVAVATLFAPLALCGLLLPSTAHWARRLAETLAALILAKPVIAGVLALAVNSALSGGSLNALVTGVALLLLAAFSPFALLRLVPAVSSGAVNHLEGISRRVAGNATDQATSGYDALRALTAPNEDVGPVLLHPGTVLSDVGSEPVVEATTPERLRSPLLGTAPDPPIEADDDSSAADE